MKSNKQKLRILYIIDIINIATGKLLPADGTPYEDETKVIAPPQQTSSPYDELEKLANLHKTGALTDGEFDRMKKRCLEKIK